MHDLKEMIWIETLKVRRSQAPLLTGLGFLLMPIACAFMMFIAKDPVFARQAGLVSAKADLLAISADWPSYLSLLAQSTAIGGIFLFSLVCSWIFGREFSDGTLKDLLAVPVPRAAILLAKFIVFALWSLALQAEVFVVGLLLGALVGLPQGSPAVILQGGLVMAVASCLTVLVVAPFALFASIGRGYLLPIGVAIFVVLFANIIATIGYGSLFPWSVPALYAGMGTQSGSLSPLSYGIVLLTGLLGIGATALWWTHADQSR